MEPLRLHRNELPWPPSERVLEAARAELAQLHRYGDGRNQDRLAEDLAGYAGVSPKRLVLSPGSDILLREALFLFAPGRTVVTVSPSFLPTIQAARQAASRLVRLRLSLPECSLKPELISGAAEGPSLVVLDNPNNPTGRVLLGPEQVEHLLERPDRLVVVDEAYYEFAGVGCAALTERHPNLLVTRSLDKAFSLAGARLGYAVAGDDFIEALQSCATYLPRCGVAAALAALEESSRAMERIRRIVELREELYHALLEMGVECYNTDTNFLLLRTPHPDAAAELADRGILTADLSGQMPPGFLRVTVGTAEQNRVFLEACREGL